MRLKNTELNEMSLIRGYVASLAYKLLRHLCLATNVYCYLIGKTLCRKTLNHVLDFAHISVGGCRVASRTRFYFHYFDVSSQVCEVIDVIIYQSC